MFSQISILVLEVGKSLPYTHTLIGDILQRKQPLIGTLLLLQGIFITLYNIYYVINVVSDLRKVGCFLRVPWFPPPLKLTATI